MPRFTWCFVVSCFCVPLLLAGCGDDDPATPPDPLSNEAFVFVDAVHGSAGAAGTKAAPLADLQAGIDLAASAGKDVCIAAGAYEVDSASGAAVTMAAGVSLFGGYANDGGAWTADAGAVTTVRDLAGAGGAYGAPRAAIICAYGPVGGDAPVIGNITVEAGGGDVSTAVFVGDSTSVTLRGCTIVVGDAVQASGVMNTSSSRDTGSLVTIESCDISGGQASVMGGQVVGVAVSRADLEVRETVIHDLHAGYRTFGIDCGYGDIVIADCAIDGGTAPTSTRALYLNEAFTCAVTGCTLGGGEGGTESFAIQAMDTEEASSIADNIIDGGAGTTSVCLEMGWVEVNPAVDGNLFRVAGGTHRFGIIERDNVADPVSLTGNIFDGSLLAGPGTSILYRDWSGGAATDVTDIAVLNALDEDGLNPAGTVAGNTLAAR